MGYIGGEWEIEVTDQFGEWRATLSGYERAVPAADDLYDVYLDELRKEGLL